ncbi:MAG: glycosyltransferase [Clostridiales bacterium]|nr:glycosyltransferase [Clostridiales bacterium]
MNDLVSIIMPMHNSEKYVAESIDSVIAQTYINWELIIVDDGSTDKSVSVVDSYDDERITLLHHEKAKGAAMARNYALREAKGRWIAFLDSDDLWMPEKLEKQVNFMKRNHYSFSYTSYSEIEEDGSSRNIVLTGPKKINRALMYAFNFMGCLTVMYDSNVMGVIQIADLKKRNDYAIWLKAVHFADAYYLNENLAKYRVRKSNSVSTSNTKIEQQIKCEYDLFHVGQEMNPVVSIFLVCCNVVMSKIKKIFYRENKY